MDIEYLLLLQNFRNSINDLLTPFMNHLSNFGVSYIFLLPTFVYWCMNKKKGLYIWATYIVSIGLNAVSKLMACVYRPWIKDPRIIPPAGAIERAGGYSFPSGHTTTVTAIYGGLAVISWKKKLLFCFWVMLILLTGFSRNYLGVHTPQDVIVGLLLGIFGLFLTARIFKYIEAHREKENLFLLLGFIIGILALLYITFKSYPMDYIDGKLLVDPDKMTRTGWGDISFILGLTVGRYVEKRWIKFTPTGLNCKGIILGILGLIILGVMIYGLRSVTTNLLGFHWGRLASSFIQIFYVIAIWPMVIKLFSCKGK